MGRRRVQAALETKWGRLFREYGDGTVVLPGMEAKTLATALGLVAGAVGLAGFLAWAVRRRK